jgi:hypothetical protein
LHRLGELYGGTGRVDLAAETLGRAVAIQQVLVQRSPRDANARTYLANTMLALGETRLRAGLSDQARQVWGASLSHFEQVVRDHPQNTDFALALASAHANLGSLAGLGALDPEETLVHLASAAKIQQGVLTAHPEIGYGWHEWEVTLGFEQAYWLSIGQPEGRLRTTREHLEWLESVGARLGKRGDISRTSVRLSLADAYRLLGRPEEALAEIDVVEAQAGAETPKPEPRHQSSRMLSQALLAAGKGDTATAMALAEKASELAPVDGEILYGAAAVASRCAARAKSSEELALHSANAVELLKRSWAAGFPAPIGPQALLLSDRAFDALRSRDDFWRYLDALPKPDIQADKAAP